MWYRRKQFCVKKCFNLQLIDVWIKKLNNSTQNLDGEGYFSTDTVE